MSKRREGPFLRVTPLGGVGEIGSNCSVFESKNEILIVDYGILFPYEDVFDINYLIASLDRIKDTKKKVAIFITHGHEDHIGAITHLNQVFPTAPIFAPKFAELLIRAKLARVGQTANITVYDESDVIEFDGFQAHPIAVTHSIPDTYGVLIKASNSSVAVLFISDFKYDLNPLYEKPFNTEKIKALFQGVGKSICMMDSTNILYDDKTLSERDLVPDLEEIIRQPRRLFFTLFSSNIHRLKTILRLAHDNGKRVIPVGRSINSYLESAQNRGLLEAEELSTLRKEEEARDPENPSYVYILTGCQGDHFGALRRVATGEHKFLKPGEGDCFVFSSKPIPGNESKIYRIYNQLTESGATIITHKDKRIHASGHPGKEDLRQLYRAINPDVIIPIHGESYFLKKHCDFVRQEGFAETLLLSNFKSLCISATGELSTEQLEEEPPQIIHGKGLVIEREAISKRRKMANSGVCIISVHAKSRKLSLSIAGLPQSIEKDLHKIINLVKGQMGRKLMEKDPDYIAEELRIFTRNLFQNFLGYKPVTFVHVI